MRIHLFCKLDFFVRLNKLVLVVLLPLLTIACGKNTSQDGLGQLAFKALKHNDYASYARYLVSKNETLYLLGQLKNSPSYAKLSADKHRHFNSVFAGIDARVERHHQQLQQNFNATFDYGVRQGIAWSKSNFVKIEVANEQRVFDLKGATQQTIYIVFTQNEKTYRLRLRNNVKITRGWVIVDGFAWEAMP